MKEIRNNKTKTTLRSYGGSCILLVIKHSLARVLFLENHETLCQNQPLRISCLSSVEKVLSPDDTVCRTLFQRMGNALYGVYIVFVYSFFNERSARPVSIIANDFLRNGRFNPYYLFLGLG